LIEVILHNLSSWVSKPIVIHVQPFDKSNQKNAH
jgi:hypothetical protein